MANKKANTLPSVELKPGQIHNGEPGAVVVGVDVTSRGATHDAIPGIETVVIELPIGPRSNGYLNERVNMHLTTQVQRVAMQRLRNGLIESRAVLKDGTKVSNEQHAIRWLLESLPIES